MVHFGGIAWLEEEKIAESGIGYSVPLPVGLHCRPTGATPVTGPIRRVTGQHQPMPPQKCPTGAADSPTGPSVDQKWCREKMEIPNEVQPVGVVAKLVSLPAEAQPVGCQTRPTGANCSPTSAICHPTCSATKLRSYRKK